MICARSEVGLSRLPVTEEIAGSNPVERATDIFHPDRVFFYGKYTIFIAFLYNLCYYIANWTGRSKEFYNKISDNVRGRIPSVMVRNREQFNPSDSEKSLSKKIMALIGATAFALGAAGCSDSESYRYKEPTPDTTTSTSQESENPSSETSTDTTEPVPQEIIDKYKDINLSDLRDVLEKEKNGEEVSYSEWRATFAKFVNENLVKEDDKIPVEEYETVSSNRSNFAKDIRPVIKNNVIGIFALGSIRRDSVEYGYPFSVEEMKKIDKGVFNVITVGQAKYLLADITVYDKDEHFPYIFNVKDITDITVEEVFESTGRTYEGNPTGWISYIPDGFATGEDQCGVEKYVSMCRKTNPNVDFGPNETPDKKITTYGYATTEISTVYKVSFKDNENDELSIPFAVRAFINKDEDASDLNVPGYKQVDSRFINDDDLHITSVIAGFSILTKDDADAAFLEKDGVKVSPGAIPEVAKLLK